MNQTFDFYKLVVRPFIVPVGAILTVVAIIIAIGESLLAVYDHSRGIHTINRPELWIATGIALVTFAAAWVLAHSKPGTAGPLEKDVVIGNEPFFAVEPPPVSEQARSGPQGTADDIVEGYTLYSQSGVLARVVGIVPGSVENGRNFRGYMYANGLYGASAQLWIPFEAVYAVYPETKSAFLAIKGDETEHYGWNRMPESMSRAPRATKEPPRN